MRTKHFVARYRMLCECGAGIAFRRQSPDAKAIVAVREKCPDCGAMVYTWLAGEDAYKPRPETMSLQFAILDVFADIEPPMTVRQMYYQLSARHVVDKTEAGYNRVQRTLTEMRRAGAVPYNWLSDNSRSFYSTQQYQGLNDALRRMHDYYRRDLWATQTSHVEIWLEKRALVSQLTPVCSEYGVKLFPCGGYSSISFAYEAASEWENLNKIIYVYHLSDLDADGAFSSVALEKELRAHTDHPIIFRRLALDFAQVAQYGLTDALRPQKRTSTRFNWWMETYGDRPACELDALHPHTLRQIVRDAIESHVDKYELEMTRSIEREERATLAQLVENGF